MGEWVLREACRETASWPKPLTIAVNVSAVQFRRGNLSMLVHSILLETGLAPGRLELEITETVTANDFSRAVSILNQLKSLGVRIEMDDFGTGHLPCRICGLSVATKFRSIEPLSTIWNRIIIQGNCACGYLGGSKPCPADLAEGVETEAQLDFSRGRVARRFRDD